MPNDYFQFKQFTVKQAASAMKVSTDGCLFGAWIHVPDNDKRILDVGCGTGLLSLMVAQRHPAAQITGLEIDPAAADEARQNVADSPFAGQMEIVCADAREWRAERRFDAVLCNPPFFRGSLLGPDAARNTARHALSFSVDDFVVLLEQVTTDDTQAYVLLPAREEVHWRTTMLNKGWYCAESLAFKTKRHAAPTGVMVQFGRTSQEEKSSVLDVYAAEGGYSPDAIALLSPYYLYL